ncbi:MAG TPA: family 16 glycosylhydrolase [Ohtaekwangia sp.]|uniref:family 16 glycosylhydrolase n=1 Tax=Ohtaekwangia sp. TaxID=2066019 RepID=UPI002F927A5C
MKIVQIVFATACLLVCARSSAQTWQLEWSDEFTSSISSAWGFDIGNGTNGWGNNELEYYRRENATIENGQLVITAKQESFGGFNYTSSKLTTGSTGYNWRYGRIEARMQLPAFQGSWPAFWMLGTNISGPGGVGWPACGEIDIMEQVNTNNTVHGTIHWDNNGYTSYGGSVGTNVTGYHVYAIEWDENSIKWFVDGAQYHEANIQNNINGTNEFHNTFFIILNLAIGGNWPGFTVNNAALPAKMYVDYVRVYKRTTSTGTAPIGSTIWLRGNNNSYVSSENGTAPMMCNRPTVQAWEQFTVVDAGGGKVALRSMNKYVSSENGAAAITCNRTTIGDWEKFDWVPTADGKVGLRGNNGRYISSENGVNAMTCTRTTLSGWEAFSFGTGTGARLATNEETAQKLTTEDELTVFPNPAAGTFTIKVSSPSTVSITSTSGVQILRSEVQDVLPVSKVPAGIYLVRMSNAKRVITKKIVVE